MGRSGEGQYRDIRKGGTKLEKEAFPMSRFFASGGQSIGVSAAATVLPMNIQD